MNILIVGLGLIGGSYAKALKKLGYKIYGVDKDLDTINYALDNNIIDFGSLEALDFINIADVIIICLYPKAVLNFIEKYNENFKFNQIITDVCGVKSSLVYKVDEILKNGIYISHHPMAGREKVGIKYSDEKIFAGANFLITPIKENQYAIEILTKMAYDMKFGNVSVMSPIKHDKMIGFTSQLTHAIAVSLVNSDTDNDTKKYIGDSYRDLTRIAMINEVLWSELFLENKDSLIEHIVNFEDELKKLKEALLTNDKDMLKELFVKSTKIRKEMEK